MKNLKFFAISFIASVMAISFYSCGDDDNNDNNNTNDSMSCVEKSLRGVTDLTDNGSSLSYSISNTDFVYYYDTNNKITKLVQTEDFCTEESAKNMYNTMKNSDVYNNVELSVKGSCIVITTTDPDLLGYETVNEVKELHQNYKEAYKGMSNF